MDDDIGELDEHNPVSSTFLALGTEHSADLATNLSQEEVVPGLTAHQREGAHADTSLQQEEVDPEETAGFSHDFFVEDDSSIHIAESSQLVIEDDIPPDNDDLASSGSVYVPGADSQPFISQESQSLPSQDDSG